MVAKMVLPSLGGTPAVWNTCMVFFQAALLAGYAYAHATTGWLGTRRQVILHGILLFLPFLVLPIGVASGWVPPGDANPIPWLLALLVVSVGLPFFLLSTSAPLLQKWFAHPGHHSARDPYFLYAASLLWVMPLALYLLRFILVFARWPNWLHQTVVVILPLVILVLLFIMLSKIIKWPIAGTIGLHLLTLFLVALVCHGELARTR